MAENMPQTQVQSQVPGYADDEIDLVELWNSLWEQKALIAALTALITSLGVAYALLATPVYKAETFFLPPLQQDVQSLKLQNMQNMQNMQNITPDSVYKRFLQNIQSRSLQMEFYKTNGLRDFYAQNQPVKSESELFTEEFNKKLALNIPKSKQDSSFVSLSFELPREANKSALWLNAYVDFVAKKTLNELLTDVNFEIQTGIQNAEDQIQSKRALAKQRREDRIASLKESLRIAQEAGVERPAINQAANDLNMEYMRGQKALMAEIAVLTNRVSDDPFIEGIRDLQEKIAYLKDIKINPESVRVVRVDQIAEVPVSPVKPKKALIVAVAAVLGLMLGVFIALIRQAVKKRKAAQAEAVSAS
jgi:chain length determinant protein (polysaccharide antigen chain regulator)